MAMAQSRNWQTGTLMETEQQKVLEGSTSNRSGGGDGYSTTTKTDNYDTYQVFTISSGQMIYVAREHLFFSVVEADTYDGRSSA
jgi:hypothetical protein